MSPSLSRTLNTPSLAITQRRYGGPEQLSLVPVPPVGPKPSEVIVEVAASGVSQADRRLRAGDFPPLVAVPARLALGVLGPRNMPPGTTFAGRIVACGRDVSRFQVGDRVFGEVLFGAHATHLRVDESGAIARLSDAISDVDAAALVYGGITAIAFLRDMAAMQPGDHLCVLGASGGVGRVAVQLAKALGAHVTGVGGAHHAALIAECGADVVLDYRSSSYADGGAMYDVILDTIGIETFRNARRALRDGGRYLNLVVSLRLIVDVLRSRRRDQRALTGTAIATPARLDALAAWIASGDIRAHIAARFPLADAPLAHACIEQGNPGGEVVLEIANPRSAFPASARTTTTPPPERQTPLGSGDSCATPGGS